MRYAREHGFPAPLVHAVSGLGMIMDRVEGRTMPDEFLDSAGRQQAAMLLPAVAARKLGDRNIRESERRAIEDLVADEASGRLST